MLNMIRVLIADDSKNVRRGIRVYLEQTDDLQVVGEASDGEEAVRLAEKLKPDVLLLDVLMPNMDGIQVLKNLKESAFNGKVLAMSAVSGVEHLIPMLNNGANGFLTKEDPMELVQAIRSIRNSDKKWISPRIK